MGGGGVGGVETYGEKQQKRNQKHGKEVNKSNTNLKRTARQILYRQGRNHKTFFTCRLEPLGSAKILKFSAPECED
jgi:hypothetical protein